MMKVYVYEGAPEEVVAALKMMEGSPGAAEEKPKTAERSAETEDDEEEEDDWKPVSPIVARRMLTRRDLRPKPKKALRAIYEAGDAGILGTELQKLLGYDQAQFRGMMGALGRRLVNTDGYEEGTSFFSYEWDYDVGSYRYRLPESAREAVRKEVIEK